MCHCCCILLFCAFCFFLFFFFSYLFCSSYFNHFHWLSRPTRQPTELHLTPITVAITYQPYLFLYSLQLANARQEQVRSLLTTAAQVTPPAPVPDWTHQHTILAVWYSSKRPVLCYAWSWETCGLASKRLNLYQPAQWLLNLGVAPQLTCLILEDFRA